MSNATAPAIQLKGDAYAEWMERLKLVTEDQQAEHLGISRATIGRARRGEITPGETFIAACMAKYDRRFEDLFEITEAS